MKRFVICVAPLVLLPAAAGANETISDWMGRSATFVEGKADSGGVAISYHVAGEGPLVIFVHSIFGPWFDFRHQMVALSETHRVVSMSTRGTDRSDKPEGVEHYASARIADDINALIDHFGEEMATIVGQDSGGLHAWHFAMTHPERTAGLISLGSVHPAGLIRELIDNEAQQQSTQFQNNMLQDPQAGEQLSGFIGGGQMNPDDPADVAELRRDAYSRLEVESIVNFYKANWPRPPVTADTVGFGFKLGEFPPVQAPTLFIYGENSGPFKPETLNNMWQWVDGPLTIQVLPGVGHGPHTEAPEFVTPRIVEWLTTGR
ncbi:MAG: hypothetical protein CL483_02095 [Acidobacteria bacterium]|nr:hypothetical protein [Acidobacteriota bacterium]